MKKEGIELGYTDGLRFQETQFLRMKLYPAAMKLDSLAHALVTHTFDIEEMRGMQERQSKTKRSRKEIEAYVSGTKGLFNLLLKLPIIREKEPAKTLAPLYESFIDLTQNPCIGNGIRLHHKLSQIAQDSSIEEMKTILSFFPVIKILYPSGTSQAVSCERALRDYMVNPAAFGIVANQSKL